MLPGTKLILETVTYKVEEQLGQGGFGEVYKVQEEVQEASDCSKWLGSKVAPQSPHKVHREPLSEAVSGPLMHHVLCLRSLSSAVVIAVTSQFRCISHVFVCTWVQVCLWLSPSLLFWLMDCGPCTEAIDKPPCWAMKVAGKSELVFAVESIAASKARAVAQEQVRWQGRVFLPFLRAVGPGRVVDDLVEDGEHSANVLVMELAHGTLENHKGFSGDSLIMVAWGLASTLSLLNRAGFVHGDLKPSNILWRNFDGSMAKLEIEGLNGWPLLSDFGSAQCFHSMSFENRPVESDEKIEAYGWTPAFAAPEVKMCRGKWQTMRSDMYSYAKTLQAIGQHSRLPECLQKICNACLQEKPEKRPASFREIADDLEENRPQCLEWGRQLWEQQQAKFSSPALAHQHSSALQEQGLQVLVAQRENRLRLLMENHKTKQVIEPYMALAREYRRLGSPAPAIELCREALMLNPCWAVHPALLANLGNAEGSLGNAARRKEHLERALKIEEGFFGLDHPEVAKTLTNLGIAEGSLGNPTRKKEILEGALKIFEGFYGQDHPEVAITLTNLGNAEGDLGNPTMQKELLERAFKIFEGFYGQDHPEVANILTSLGIAEGSLGNPTMQKEVLERALKIKEGFYGQDHPEVATTLTNLGNAEGSLGNAARRKEHLERALKIEEGFFGLDHPEVAKTLTNLGNAEGDLGNAAKKKELLERALKIEEASMARITLKWRRPWPTWGMLKDPLAMQPSRRSSSSVP